MHKTNHSTTTNFQLTVPVIWMLGLSGAGKTTLANGLAQKLKEQKIACTLLDGDELRKGLNKNLGFSEADRMENLRRAAEVAKLFQHSGVLPICSFISPSHEMRVMIAEILGAAYCEVFVNCSIEVCGKRDVKGLYAMARKNEVANFTGLTASFEAPQNPALVLNTELNDYETCLQQLNEFVLNKVHTNEL